MYTYFSAAKLADYSYTPFLTMELLDREYKLDLSCINRLHDADLMPDDLYSLWLNRLACCYNEQAKFISTYVLPSLHRSL